MNGFLDNGEILINTHKKENIDLLKVRDYYFDKARALNRVKLFFIFLPLLLVVASFMIVFEEDSFFANWKDLILGVFSIGCFFVVRLIQSKIDDRLNISNAFREEYDVRVFNIRKNPLVYNNVKLEDYLHCARYVPDQNKYEAWYAEIFCGEKYLNILCAQMDNVIYTYYVYEATKKLWNIILSLIITATIGVFLLLFVSGNISGAFLIVIAMFDIIQVMYEEQVNMVELIKVNSKIKQDVLAGDIEAMNCEHYIRCLQDVIIRNRDKSIFIPKVVRMKFLENGNPFYVDLDEVKYKFMEPNNALTVETAADIPVISLTDGDRLISMETIHDHLRKMFEDVITVWEANDIHYTLDGGTLLGAVRDGGKILFWDDDVDVMLPISEVERAKKILLEKLGDRYDIQDFYNEEYYSPRLSNFRVRERNSKVSEKDSPLYEKYASRGLFLDVYAYSPVVGNKRIDAVYRKCLFHPLNKKLKEVENRMIHGESASQREAARKKFLRYKKRYLRRLEQYIKRAWNTDFVCYSPNYLDDIDKAGPYINGADLTGERTTCEFEGRVYYVPNNPEGVLEKCYGKGWRQSPFRSKALLKEEYKMHWFSEDKFNVSVLKHIRYIDII